MEGLRFAVVLLLLVICVHTVTARKMKRSLTIRRREYPGPTCLLPLNAGKDHCDMMGTYYYYNKDAGQCQSFDFRGCGGNDNRFPTLEKCQKVCMQPEVCRLQRISVTGLCGGPDVNLYYYNKNTGQCHRMGYPDCNGNAFFTKEACERTCDVPSQCQWEGISVTGLCGGPNVNLYYYNKHTGQCHRMGYPDCTGNAFFTMEACQKTCDVPDWP